MQAVGQLHQQHANVVRHREQEFAEILGGALVLALCLDLGELGDAVDHPRDVLAKQALDLVVGGDGILDRVVQDRGDDRFVVEPQIGQDAGDLDRMAEIGIARSTLLAAMGLHRKDIGAVDKRLVGVRIVAADPLHKFILSEHAA